MDCNCPEGYFIVTERTIARQTLGKTDHIYTVSDIGKRVETMKKHVHDCDYIWLRNAKLEK